MLTSPARSRVYKFFILPIQVETFTKENFPYPIPFEFLENVCVPSLLNQQIETFCKVEIRKTCPSRE